MVGRFRAALVGGTAHKRYLEALGFCAERVFLGYDVVDNDYFRAQSDAARRDAAAVRARFQLPEAYFLASARLVPTKNLLGLIDAYQIYVAKVGAAAWNLVVLGDGPERENLEAKVGQMRLSGRVQFPGFKQYPELPAYYGLAQALVHVSRAEPWGLVVNEAMAAGLPVVVSSACGCAADLVHDGKNGFLVDATKIESVADRLLLIASNRVDLDRMGRASRRIIENWSPLRFVSGAADAIHAALGGDPASASPVARMALSVVGRAL
jgi:1,2-diacylglycerol 3-alpha-glucosyltransferase